MFVITQADVAAVVEAYRASESLDAAAAALCTTFRALTESQARRIAAQIIGVPHDPEDPAPTALRRPQSSARILRFPSRR